MGDCTLNKNELIASVAKKADVTKAVATRAIDAVIASITGALKSGKEIRLVGFGSFVVVNRKATDGRNPRTGEKIRIPASKQPKFRPGKGLKEAINGIKASARSSSSSSARRSA
jgi:DNA-binding protein HU-beta